MTSALPQKRVVAAIQARTGSSRLPRKVLSDLCGRTLIERVVERARLARAVDEVVVLTSREPGDDELEALCLSRGIRVRRGSEGDVLSRYLEMAQEFEPDFVVRITGDCPLIEPAFIDHQLSALLSSGADFTRLAPGGVDGTLCGMGVLSTRALRAAAKSTDPRDREHVGTFFFQTQRERFRWQDIEVDGVYRRQGLRLTVDEAEDLELVRTVFEEFAPFPKSADFLTADVIRWLDAHPEVAAINGAVRDSADNRELRRLRRIHGVEAARGAGAAEVAD